MFEEQSFRTKIEANPYEKRISHSDNLTLFGSCFSDHIGELLQLSKFDIVQNPFGTLYNPMSIKAAISRLLSKKEFYAEELFESYGMWHSFMHHGSFSSASKEDCLQKINHSFSEAVTHLEKTNILIITFGSAWIYMLNETGKVVSNCHKLSANIFSRRKLTVDEIVSEYEDLLSDIWELNPKMRIIFSVSPIRHWKDGAHENTLSKSTLLLAIDALQQKFNNVEYFPSYELLMDDLRDYRFYTEDMIHPSNLAVSYIWKFFCKTYFSEQTIKTVKAMQKLSLTVAHKPLHADSEEYERFCKQQLAQIEILSFRYPMIDFSKEREHFSIKNKKNGNT